MSLNENDAMVSIFEKLKIPMPKNLTMDKAYNILDKRFRNGEAVRVDDLTERESALISAIGFELQEIPRETRYNPSRKKKYTKTGKLKVTHVIRDLLEDELLNHGPGTSIALVTRICDRLRDEYEFDDVNPNSVRAHIDKVVRGVIEPDRFATIKKNDQKIISMTGEMK